MHGIDARLMFAKGKRRRVEDKSVQLVRCSTGSQNIRSRRIRNAVSNESPVNVELHFDMSVRVA
jgi:hypothetical protein